MASRVFERDQRVFEISGGPSLIMVQDGLISQRSFIDIKSFKSPIKWETTKSPILIVRLFRSLTLNMVHFLFGTAQMEGTAQNVDKP